MVNTTLSYNRTAGLPRAPPTRAPERAVDHGTRTRVTTKTISASLPNHYTTTGNSNSLWPVGIRVACVKQINQEASTSVQFTGYSPHAPRPPSPLIHHAPCILRHKKVPPRAALTLSHCARPPTPTPESAPTRLDDHPESPGGCRGCGCAECYLSDRQAVASSCTRRAWSCTG
eukprot:scaffold18751_cov245-Isochrysis_galbana.AAC.8